MVSPQGREVYASYHKWQLCAPGNSTVCFDLPSALEEDGRHPEHPQVVLLLWEHREKKTGQNKVTLMLFCPT